MRLYVAAHSQDEARKVAAVLKDAGYVIMSTWLEEDMKRTADYTDAERQAIAEKDHAEVLASDALVCLSWVGEESPIVPPMFSAIRPRFPEEDSREYRPAVYHGEMLMGYWVSSSGEILSQWGFGAISLLDHARVMKVREGGLRGLHLVITLRGGEAEISTNVHAIIAESFFGPRPEGMVVCHNDGNSHNNNISNLRFDTPKANEADKLRHGTHQFGERNPSASLTDQEAEQIRVMRRAGVKLKVISQQFGVSESTVSRIANGIRRRIAIDNFGGKFVEVGVAIGSGKPIYLLGHRENMLMWHPSVRQFNSVEDLVKTLG